MSCCCCRRGRERGNRYLETRSDCCQKEQPYGGAPYTVKFLTRHFLILNQTVDCFVCRTLSNGAADSGITQGPKASLAPWWVGSLFLGDQMRQSMQKLTSFRCLILNSVMRTWGSKR